jgi:long-chain alkane monooxygenase
VIEHAQTICEMVKPPQRQSGGQHPNSPGADVFFHARSQYSARIGGGRFGPLPGRIQRILFDGNVSYRRLQMYHLGWFLGNGFGIQTWDGVLAPPYAGTNPEDWTKPDLYIDLAQSLERAGFSYILIEDTAMIEDTFGGSAETTLRRGLFAPKNDPVPLIPLITNATKHIGIISTVSTIQYPPFLAARMFVSLDHVTEGRVGMNIVTSVTDRVAQNFGYDQHLEHDERYVMAAEWSDIVIGLQNSWEPDAIVNDVPNNY